MKNSARKFLTPFIMAAGLLTQSAIAQQQNSGKPVTSGNFDCLGGSLKSGLWYSNMPNGQPGFGFIVNREKDGTLNSVADMSGYSQVSASESDFYAKVAATEINSVIAATSAQCAKTAKAKTIKFFWSAAERPKDFPKATPTHSAPAPGGKAT